MSAELGMIAIHCLNMPWEAPFLTIMSDKKWGPTLPDQTTGSASSPSSCFTGSPEQGRKASRPASCCLAIIAKNQWQFLTLCNSHLHEHLVAIKNEEKLKGPEALPQLTIGLLLFAYLELKRIHWVNSPPPHGIAGGFKDENKNWTWRLSCLLTLHQAKGKKMSSWWPEV